MADDVNLKIAVDAEAAVKSLQNLEKNSIKSVKNMEAAFNGLKTVAVAAVGFLAARGILDFFEEGIKGAIAQEQAFARLEAQMIATGENSEEAAKAFNDLAGELESTTKFGDDAVLSAAALAKSYGLTNQQALELTRTAADLASATGVELEAAVEQLTASYSGNVKALGKLVPEVKGLTKEQLAAGDAVEILGKRFAGAANKEIQTYAGAVKQASNAFENFREAFGTLVTQNKSVVATINTIGKVFQDLQKIVEDNQYGLSNFITFGIRALITSFTVLGPVVNGTIKILEGFVFGVSLAFTGVLEAITPFAEALDLLPGSATSTADALEQIKEKSTGVSRSILKGFGEASKAVTDTSKAADKLAQSIFDATETTADGMGKAEKSTASFGRTVVKSADDIAKLRDEGQKFLADLNKAGASEIEKVVLDAEDAQKKLGELVKSGALTVNEVRAASFKITQNQILKEIELRDKANKQLIEDAKKAAEEAKARIASIAADPITFTVKAAEIQPLDISQQAKDASALSVGFLSKVLDGAAGAKSLISAGAGAFADSLLPGIGGAVGGLISKLAEGPESAKKFVKEFVAAVPQIVDAIAESIPQLVETLVDVLINKGGAVKIGIAIARAMSGEAILKNIGKQIGVSFGSSFNADVIGQKIGNGFLSIGEKLKFAFIGIGGIIAASFALAGSKFSATLSASFQKIVATFVNVGKLLYDSAFSGLIKFGQAFSTIVRASFADIGRRIIEAFAHGGNVVAEKIIQPFIIGGNLILGALTAGLNNIVGLFSSLGEAIIAPIREFFSTGLTDAINQAFSGILNFFQNNLFDSVQAAFKPVIDFLDNFRIEIPNAPGTPSKSGGLISGTGTPLDFLAKGGIVYAANGFKPRGTDTVPAMLTPGEMVLNRGQQGQLFDLASSGGSEVPALLETLISLMSQPQTTEVTAEINGKAIADIVLQQSRQRARLSA